jgi:hypothetical protein
MVAIASHKDGQPRCRFACRIESQGPAANIEMWTFARFSAFFDFRSLPISAVRGPRIRPRRTYSSLAETPIFLIHVNETDANFRFRTETSIAYRLYARKEFLRRLRRIPKFPKLELSYREVPGE